MKNNVKIYLKETGFESEDWIHLAHDRVWWRVLVNMEMNFEDLTTVKMSMLVFWVVTP
jgi:hypothetical protein